MKVQERPKADYLEKMRLDMDKCNLSKADWEKGTGVINLSGGLILNYVRVRCHAEIDLAKLKGEGWLEILEEVTPAQLAKERAERNASL